MAKVGFHASHEQFPPDELLALAQAAQAAGFHAVYASDHLHPWSDRQGDSGFVWSWLGAALQATDLPFGVVTAPGYRYHPVILAQAVATLSAMFPGRFTLTMGSGEALNEQVIGAGWPVKADRNQILKESADIMRRLWQGEEVTHHGLVVAEQAKLFVHPSEPVDIVGAALTPATAAWLGEWADGLITTSRPLPELRELVDAFYANGGNGKRVILKAQVSYDTTHDKALRGAYDQWRYTLLPSAILSELRTTEQFDAAGKLVPIEEVERQVKIVSRPEELTSWLHGLMDAFDFETIILHNVNENQAEFIEWAGKGILPEFAA
jgi:probable non-F420 flavinoid oxidoreductase